MDQYIGKILDNRYEILELIGVGGMAKVYKARCHRLNRLVAVKILRDDLSQDSDFRRRFQDESHAVAMLSHPNIMAVYDVSRSSELEYIVMELIDGISLKQYMQKKGNKLNWREALHFITQIVKALGHAHSRGIIHRDIKPHNVMVLRDGSVKVTDFGIARLISAGHSTLTQETLGSVHYISPEQARGSHIDARSDLYSAGVVLYEMTTGRLPFEGDSPVSVAIQHINSIPLSPRELNAEIPEALEAITMKAMEPKVEKRYASADAMLADLEEFRKNPNINFDYSASDLNVAGETDDIAQERTQPISIESLHRQRSAKGSASGRAAERPSNIRKSKRSDYDDYDEQGPNWPIFAAVIAILAFTVGIMYVFYSSFIQPLLVPAPDYVIPELSGLVYEQVLQDRELLKEFMVTVSSEIPSEEPAGTILRQVPEGETTTKDPKTEISVTVSSGPEIINMPSVVGWEYIKALVELQNMGLRVPVPEYETHEEIPSNHVISHTPLEGTVMRPGDKVQLIVSKGPAEKLEAVPLFVGQTEEWARNKAELQNLVIDEVFHVWNSEYEAGVVVDQSVDAYTEVAQGTKINLQVSKGVDPSTIAPKEQTRSFQIALPDEPSVIQIEVRDGDRVIMSRSADTSLDAAVTCTVTGTGVKHYQIFFNGTLIKTETVTFGS